MRGLALRQAGCALYKQGNPDVKEFNRRALLKHSGLAVASTAMLGVSSDRELFAAPSSSDSAERQPLKKTYRAAAIGSTGHGGFGHHMDQAVSILPGVQCVAIADDDPAGLQAAGKRNGVDRLYPDYRTMLKEEQLDLVSIGLRYSELHEEIVIDCAQAGKHIFCEKPLAPDLASLDRMLKACEQNGVQLAVSLPNRSSLAIAKALKMVRDGRIGKLLSLRARGKEDYRGGGEDLMVLGYHMLDLMCLFAGQPEWTFAQVMEGNRDMIPSDARRATEPIGPVAGDCITAMYGFPNQVHGYFESHRGLQAGGTQFSGDRFSLEIHGSKGILATRSMKDVVWFDGPILNPAKPHQWEPISTPEWDAIGTVSEKALWCQKQQVLDLLQAVEEDREPVSSGKETRWTQEMIQSVYVSHLARDRVSLPLQQREHPLR